MKVLFLSTQLPYPPNKGGLIKSFRLLKHLSSKMEVTLLCPLVEANDFEQIPLLIEKIPGLKVKGIPLNKERSLKTFLQSYVKGKTLNEWRKYSNRIELLTHQHLLNAKLVVVDHYEVFQYVPSSYNGKIVLHIHNAEFKMWQRYSRLSINPLRRIVLLAEAKRIKRSELEASRLSHLIFAAPNDAQVFIDNSKKSLSHDKFENTYHLGDEKLLALPDLNFNESKKSILFFGTLSWEANKDGVMWFITRIWPGLLEKDKSLTFFIIGSNPPLEIRKLAKKHKRIVFTGFVENLDTYFSQCRVFVNPIRFGSGIKVKMIDAMYRGIPTVTTPIGTESLNLKNGKEVLIASSPKEWIKAILSLLNQPNTWNSISKTSRSFARANFQWEPMLNTHSNKINTLLEIDNTQKHAV